MRPVLNGINGVPLYVAGVIRDKEKPSPRSGEVTKSVVYASYQAWSRLVELPTIQCYETVLPNLISNFGYQQIEKAFQMRFGEEGEIITVENSNRFAFRESWKNVFDSQYSLDTSGINLPHWELRARVVVREAALLVACVFIVFFALLCVSVGMWIRWRRSS